MPDYLSATKNIKIAKIVKDIFGNFWFCSKGAGLFKLTKEDQLFQYKIEHELPSNVVNDISFNVDNSVLLSINNGLFHTTKFKKWSEVYTEQGYTAVGFKNDVYFMTKDGLVIEKNNKQIEQHKIYFNFSSVFVNSNLSNENVISNLNYDQNNLEFNFDVISFSSNVPDMMYQLHVPKSQIAVSKNQNIILQNLPPGNYMLTVFLINCNNRSSSIIVHFNIRPAFWQTTWFIIGCILLGTIFCVYTGWCIMKYYRRKEDRKNEANRLITEYKLTAIKAQINPHLMSNCLTAVQNLIISGKVNEANQYLAKFSFFVRQILNFSTKNMVTLKEELEITQLNIELEQLRFENKFLFELNVDSRINLQQTLLPPLIFQPIIENAIWHGLLPLKKSRKGVLKINIFLVDQTIEIVIEDNGVGRTEKKQDISNLRDSKGIQLVEQRIQTLNVLNNSSIGNLIFEDMKDESNNANGSRIKFVLPLLTDNLE